MAQMQQAGLKVLMISSDRNILIPGSAVSLRMKDYGTLADELHIMLECDKSHGLSDAKLADNVWVYPTNSNSRYFRPFDALRFGVRLAEGKSLITTQDPFECGWVGMKLKEKYGIPLEAQLHTDPFSKQFSGVLNMIRMNIAKRVFKRADAIRVVRPKVADLVSAKFKMDKSKVSVLPIYIDKSRFAGEPKFDLHSKYGFEHVILAVSRLSAEKNVQTIIESLPEIQEACLVIVGSGPEEAALKELVRERDLESRVFFEGWQEDLTSYYKTADVFVQASSFEGYGLSLAEAGLCGLPIVSTPVGIAEDMAELAKASDASSFAESINYVLAHKQESRILAEKIKKMLEAGIYSKDDYMQKIKEGWCRLAEKHP